MNGKGALLISAAILVATPAWAAWTAFGEDKSKAVWYVDTDSIRTTGALREVWAMKDMVEPEIDFDLSKLFLVEVDCQSRRQRLLHHQSYRGRMGGDEPTRGGMTFGDWMAVAPGTVGGSLSKAVCNRG
ncbi:surface-adhesin E family protein [Azohydromonas lata]|uniref:Surface-adhesin protein E-like domain-containing protein n=1 Tax=Azohydromonas lata TaxID=45677 RepID=A0ABU5IRT1_9BURK|nr:surface-adhesin E family protein [Azohydromonas lata]MDZ5461607.1 hypothetical protein [Azohydromonas lata]